MLLAPDAGGHPLTGYQRRAAGIDAPLNPALVQLLVKAGLHVSGVNDHPHGGYASHAPMRTAQPGPALEGGPAPAPRMAHPAPPPGMISAQPAPALGVGGLIPLLGQGQPASPGSDLEAIRQRLLSMHSGSNQGMLRDAARTRQVAAAMQRLEMLRNHPALRQAHPVG